MKKIIPGEIATNDLHQFLLGSVAPRPIAFVSTRDENGQDNVAPYSFFNAFSSNPPILVFSSNRRVSDNTTKDTLYNIQKTKQCVINVVNYDIVRQMAVASVQFDSGISEFEMTGLTPIPSDYIDVPRVKESPVQMECEVQEIVTLGDEGGAGHLILCKVLCMHINENVITDNRIDPDKIDLMGRMGRAYYVRASGDAIHTIIQSVIEEVIGYKVLPDLAKNSDLMTANELGILSGCSHLPSDEEYEVIKKDDDLVKILESGKEVQIIEASKSFLERGQKQLALALLFLASR